MAKAGDRVMDHLTGKTICKLKETPVVGMQVRSADFHEFEEPVPLLFPFMTGGEPDRRCVRPGGIGGVQIFIEGEWWPSPHKAETNNG